ncbi:Uncharacterized protein APZ42_013581 [Daphnia magna]|uniref:Uncharacterized protein n=1 Tax=Daphnia magna TaxID=35525 RepID=A0A162QLM5_9CRUS|nr:Uncharacterized protein APZ42_013581 [Daphnia magna]
MECHVSNAGWEIASYNKSYMSTDVSNTKEIKDKGKKLNAEKKLLSFFRHLTNVRTPLFLLFFLPQVSAYFLLQDTEWKRFSHGFGEWRTNKSETNFLRDITGTKT